MTGSRKKRHPAVDPPGLLLAVAVTGAGVSDPAGAKLLCRQLTPDRFPRLALVWADGKDHNDDLYARMTGRVAWEIAVVSRPPGEKGWVGLPRRWVAERTYAWLGRDRANSKDYERCNRSSEGMMYAGMTRLMLNRLRPGPAGPPFRYPRPTA